MRWQLCILDLLVKIKEGKFKGKIEKRKICTANNF